MQTVEEFIATEQERLNRFALAYNAGREREPDNFPEQLSEEDFLRQYDAWLEYIYDGESDLVPSNENNITKNSS